MSDFQVFISSVASRLRHDLKGGLISLRLGLEAISDEEALKPLLIERAQAMETLADKLVLLLRMGELKPEPHRLSALLGELKRRVNEQHASLELHIDCDLEGEKWLVDGDALIYALFELAQNSVLAKAGRLEIRQQGKQLIVADDGGGASEQDRENPNRLCELGLSRWERSGLGLSIAQQCALGHGGSLQVECSEPGLTVRLDFSSKGAK